MLSLSTAPENTRIAVAMSGGVDSSVTAALLVEAGYQVVGITMQLYDHGQAVGRKGACCAGQDIHDARLVAETLNIPHYVLNYESRFRQDVVEEFAESYLRGETPIPCVRCNQTVKFRDLVGVAQDIGAAAMVTGHYIRRVEGDAGPELHRAVNHEKDQSYFLFATTAEQLAYLHFPLGGMTKEETRHHAARFALPVAEKPESQDICFVPNGNYAKVIERLRPEAHDPGAIMHVDGHVLGQHDGIMHYTVGQRRGLGVATGDPLYVVRIEPEQKRVIVGPKEALESTVFTMAAVNWLGAVLPEAGQEVTVKLRSVQEPVPASVYPPVAGQYKVALHTPEAAVTPGQACVCYDGERVLGGGWITREHQHSMAHQQAA